MTLRGLGKVYQPSPSWMRLLVRSNLQRAVVALDDVDLEVLPGQICAVVGPNGAGKTTTFRILTGLTTPSSGSATVCGYDAHRESDRVRRLIGWMPAEDRSLFLRLTCGENLYFHGRLHGMPSGALRARIAETLEQVGLGPRAQSSAFSLSAGMRARLQLARALLHRPRLLILDEPTAAVDPVGAHDLLELIMGVVREYRLAALISSHRLEEIEALHSHVVLLDKGRIRYQGDLDELRRIWDRPQVELVFADDTAAHRAAAALDHLGVVTIEQPGRLRCTPAAGVVVGDLLSAVPDLVGALLHVQETSAPLRDLLADLYRRSERGTAELLVGAERT